MGKITMAVHGGAGPDSDLIKNNIQGYKKGLQQALQRGYRILEKGGSSLDAVEAAVNYLEDDPLFNAGRGSALNEEAAVEMDASIMNGANGKCGAVALITSVKNPVTLARAVMEKTAHIYLAAEGAEKFARRIGTELRPPAYFITGHSYEQFEEAAKEERKRAVEHGTVGAVALDRFGNLAAATSTGGLENKSAGRIGDSSLIGVGSYADNKTCGISCTGDGEYLMQYVSAFHVSALMEYKGLPVMEAARFFIHERCRDVGGDMGLIAIDPEGAIGFAFNSERMHRGWMQEGSEMKVFIYAEEL